MGHMARSGKLMIGWHSDCYHIGIGLRSAASLVHSNQAASASCTRKGKQMKAVQMDTTKDSIKSYLSDTKAIMPDASEQAIHKVAVVRFILDSIECDDDAIREHAAKQMLATPSGFGCNDSQLKQVLGLRVAKTSIFEQFAGKV